MDSRPFLPFSRSKIGFRSSAALIDISSTSRQATWSSLTPGHLADEGGDPVLPQVHFLLQHSKDDDGIAGGAYRPVGLDGSGQLLDGAGIVP